jgi:hypothetical protein
MTLPILFGRLFASEETNHLFPFAPCQQCRWTLTLGRGDRGVRCYQKTWGGGFLPGAIFLLLPILSLKTIFLFSLKFYDFWPVLMANLLLHDFLHLFICDAAETICPLTSCSTKIATAAQIQEIQMVVISSLLWLSKEYPWAQDAKLETYPYLIPILATPHPYFASSRNKNNCRVFIF